MNSTCPSRCHEDEGWGKCGPEVKDLSLLLPLPEKLALLLKA